MSTDDLGGDVLRSANQAATQAERERRIRTEKTRLRKMLRDGGLDDARLTGVGRVIDRAAFLAVTLADLEDEINRDGCTSEYQNGENQWGTKQSPAVQTHATFMARYLTAMKQLTDLLPDSAGGGSESDPFLDHISS